MQVFLKGNSSSVVSISTNPETYFVALLIQYLSVYAGVHLIFDGLFDRIVVDPFAAV